MRFHLRTLLLVLAILPAAISSGDENSDPSEALNGEWEVVEMIYRSTVQDFQGKCGGWFIFDKESLIVVPDGELDAKTLVMLKRIRGTRNPIKHATAIRANELDIEFWRPNNAGWITKATYELKDGRLRILWGGKDSGRPTDFDEARKDPTLTYYALKKTK